LRFFDVLSFSRSPVHKTSVLLKVKRYFVSILYYYFSNNNVRNLNSGQRAPETQLYLDLLLDPVDRDVQIDLVDMSDQVQEVRSFVLGTVAMHMEFRSDTDGNKMVPTRPFMQEFMQTAKEGLDHMVLMNVASKQVCAEQLKDAYAKSDDVFDLRGRIEELQDPARLVTDEALAGRSFNHTERQRELHKVQKKYVDKLNTEIKKHKELVDVIIQLESDKLYGELKTIVREFQYPQTFINRGRGNGAPSHYVPYSRLDAVPKETRDRLAALLPANSDVSEWYVEFDDLPFKDRAPSDTDKKRHPRVRLVHRDGVLKYASHRASAFRYDAVDLKLSYDPKKVKFNILHDVPLKASMTLNGQSIVTSYDDNPKSGHIKTVLDAAKGCDEFKEACVRWVMLDWKEVVQMRAAQKTKDSQLDEKVAGADYFKRHLSAASGPDEEAKINLKRKKK